MDPDTSPTGTRFLVVDDDDDHAALIERGLRRDNADAIVTRASDGVEALGFLRGEAEHSDRVLPDVIFLDLNMPRMSGHEVLVALKDDPDLSVIPVVILSTSESESDRMLAYENQANSYLVKPLDLLQFRDMLATASGYWGRWNRPAPV